jgi:glycosyltransferase involved in cell wall biosynthesis
MSSVAFSVIVPVHNEARILPVTVPMLLEGLSDAEVVFVCNGCTDQSPAILARIVGPRARVLELPDSGKALAIRAGEAELKCFPRFYVDADVRISGAGLTQLAARLRSTNFELVAPRLVADSNGSTRFSTLVSEIWLALPHGQSDAFHNVLGVSRAGRSRWGAFPNLLADDAFITSRIPPLKRHIDKEVSAIISLPRTLESWIRVRERWSRGERELRDLGIQPPRTPGQRRALLRMFWAGRALAVICYVAVKVCSEILSRIPRRKSPAWHHDHTSRDLKT